MIRFIFGFLLPFAAVVGYAIWTHGRFGALYVNDWAMLALTLLALPAISAYAAAAMVHTRRPRRLLLPWTRRAWQGCGIGLFVGALAILLIPVALHYANRPWQNEDAETWVLRGMRDRISDAVIVAPIAFATAMLGAWLMPRQEPGRCARCGYDVRFSIASGRCPECGHAL